MARSAGGSGGGCVGSSERLTQTVRRPAARAPAMSASGSSPTKTVRPGGTPSASSAAWKMRGSGLRKPTSLLKQATSKNSARPKRSSCPVHR